MEKFVREIIEESFPNQSDAIYNASPLIEYLDKKSGAIHGTAKTRRSLANYYAIYSILYFYVDDFFEDPDKYKKFADLFNTQIKEGLCSDWQNQKTLMGLVEKVRPGSTFWMVGDQRLLANLPASMPGPGAAAGSGNQMQIPALQTLTITGDLDPVLAFEIIGEAKDEAGARSLGDLVRGMVALAQLQSGQNPQLKELATAISVTNEASSNRVRVNARLPYELLDSLQHGQPPAQIVPEPVSK